MCLNCWLVLYTYEGFILISVLCCSEWWERLNRRKKRAARKKERELSFAESRVCVCVKKVAEKFKPASHIFIFSIKQQFLQFLFSTLQPGEKKCWMPRHPVNNKAIAHTEGHHCPDRILRLCLSSFEVLSVSTPFCHVMFICRWLFRACNFQQCGTEWNPKERQKPEISWWDESRLMETQRTV